MGDNGAMDESGRSSVDAATAGDADAAQPAPRRTRADMLVRAVRLILLYAILRPIVMLPYALQLAVGRALGRLGRHVARKQRRIVQANLRACFPELSTQELAAELTRAGAIVGSPAYMSPEQHLGELADARSDQFSFCVALHEAFYGRRPFLGNNLIELATKVTEGERAPPPKAREIPGWIYPVLERGLARDPAQRWPSMAVLIEQLDRKPQRRSWLAGVGAALISR